MVLTEHRCGHFWHRNLVEAQACHQARTDEAEREASLVRGRLSEGGALPSAVERASRAIDWFTYGLVGVVGLLGLSLVVVQVAR